MTITHTQREKAETIAMNARYHTERELLSAHSIILKASEDTNQEWSRLMDLCKRISNEITARGLIK